MQPLGETAKHYKGVWKTFPGEYSEALWPHNGTDVCRISYRRYLFRRFKDGHVTQAIELPTRLFTGGRHRTGD